MAGNSQAAFSLENGFAVTPENRDMFYFDVQNDPERSRRYKMIGKFLDRNEGLNPKVPDVDQIVPLPPAPLPPWDGTFQWEKEQAAAVPPQKPSDALVEKLAREKNLDAATGLPVAPVKSAKAERVPLGTLVSRGNVCPQDGVWCAEAFDMYSLETMRRFKKDETMPQPALNDPPSTPAVNWLPDMRVHRTDAQWIRKAYIHDA